MTFSPFPYKTCWKGKPQMRGLLVGGGDKGGLNVPKPSFEMGFPYVFLQASAYGFPFLRALLRFSFPAVPAPLEMFI